MEWNWKSKMLQNTDKIENLAKYKQKAVKISFVCGCKYVCVYVCGCMCERVDVYICFVDSGTKFVNVYCGQDLLWV